MNSIQKIYANDTCVICFDFYEKNKRNRCFLLKCGHIFHERCLTEWVKVESKCPLCQSRVFIPILLKDKLKEALDKGKEETKKTTKNLLTIISIVVLYSLIHGTLYNLISTRERTLEEYLDAYISDNCILFDLRKSEDLIKIGLSLLTVIALLSLFQITQSLSGHKNIRSDLAKRINYPIRATK